MNRFRTRKASTENEQTPMVEIFGASFAFLLILFLLINLFSEAELRMQIENANEAGTYQVNWDTGSEGYVVISFPDHLRIVETNERVDFRDICSPTSAFVSYSRELYRNPEQRQLIFAITDQGTATMAVARNCLRQILPNRRLSIGWIIANNDLLRSVNLQDLPARIQRSLQ